MMRQSLLSLRGARGCAVLFAAVVAAGSGVCGFGRSEVTSPVYGMDDECTNDWGTNCR